MYKLKNAQSATSKERKQYLQRQRRKDNLQTRKIATLTLKRNVTINVNFSNEYQLMYYNNEQTESSKLRFTFVKGEDSYPHNSRGFLGILA